MSATITAVIVDNSVEGLSDFVVQHLEELEANCTWEFDGVDTMVVYPDDNDDGDWEFTTVVVPDLVDAVVAKYGYGLISAKY